MLSFVILEDVYTYLQFNHSSYNFYFSFNRSYFCDWEGTICWTIRTSQQHISTCCCLSYKDILAFTVNANTIFTVLLLFQTFAILRSKFEYVYIHTCFSDTQLLHCRLEQFHLCYVITTSCTWPNLSSKRLRRTNQLKAEFPRRSVAVSHFHSANNVTNVVTTDRPQTKFPRARFKSVLTYCAELWIKLMCWFWRSKIDLFPFHFRTPLLKQWFALPGFVIQSTSGGRRANCWLLE